MSTFSIITLSILSVRYCISVLGTWKIIDLYNYLDFASLNDRLVIFNHSITLESSACIKYSLVCILIHVAGVLQKRHKKPWSLLSSVHAKGSKISHTGGNTFR